jgi:Phycobilisome degradation protein nblA
MHQPAQLSLEQQFNIRSFASQTENMSREEVQELLVKLYEEMILRENIYKEVLKHQWGIG